MDKLHERILNTKPWTSKFTELGIDILENIWSEETEYLRKEFEKAKESIKEDTYNELTNLKAK